MEYKMATLDPEVELLRNAMFEIQDLRRRNEILSAKVEMIELFSTVLHTEPRRPERRMSPDVAWALQKKIDEIMTDDARISVWSCWLY